MNVYRLIIVFLTCCTGIYGQQISWEAQAEATGILASAEGNPFWMVANTDGQFATQTQFSGLGALEGNYSISEKVTINAGIALFYRDGVDQEFQRRDAYLQVKTPWIQATLGAKKDTVRAQGLSATNKDFLQSGNSRPLSGLLLEAPAPLKLSNTFAVDWSLAHYSLNDNRYVTDTRVHYKRLALLANLNTKNRLIVQISHYAQWAGTSPELGKLPSDFEAFADVFFARPSSDIPTEAANALGNHLGSYLLEYQLTTNLAAISFYHEHPFEDGSGTGWANFPDGVWGVHLKPTKNKWIQGLLYEYVTTTNQSAGTISGDDNYFKNNIYLSGWSYDNNIIGLPFILFDPTVVVGPESSPIITNTIQVHHLAATGSIKRFSWMAKTSLPTYYNVRTTQTNKKIQEVYNFLSVQYNSPDKGTLKVMLGMDFKENSESLAGIGLTYSYIF